MSPHARLREALIFSVNLDRPTPKREPKEPPPTRKPITRMPTQSDG